jgi:hypothetical protein
MRQNRRGHTEVIQYKGYEILIRKNVRNDSDISYSIIVTEPLRYVTKSPSPLALGVCQVMVI